MSWSLRFDEPIVVPDGAKLASLGEAVAHLGKVIPKPDHDMPAVTTATELLTKAAEHGGGYLIAQAEFAFRISAPDSCSPPNTRRWRPIPLAGTIAAR